MNSAFSTSWTSNANQQLVDQTTADSPVRHLVIDLDGTLIRSDSTYEAIVLLLKHRPWSALKLPFWALSGGKAKSKYELGTRVKIDGSVLPYNESVLEAAKKCRQQGGKVILATAATQAHAQLIADATGAFDAVVGSDEHTNLIGKAKRDRILQTLETLCSNSSEDTPPAFDFIGDDLRDLPVWETAGRAMIVSPSVRFQEKIAQVLPIERVFPAPKHHFRAAIRAMRVQQWVKNLLVFIPLLVSHSLPVWENGQLTQLGPWIACFWAMLCFSLLASAIYLLNDLFDLDSDRHHRTKRKRPFAAGDLPLRTGLFMAAGLAPLSLILAICLLPPDYSAVLLAYLVITTSYSMLLKRKPIIDVICLAGLYTLRVFAGGIATAIEPSPWLLAFSMFTFVSLAFVKRYTELDALKQRQDPNDTPKQIARGRGYQVSDLDMIRVLGPMNGFLAILVFCLYAFNSDNAANLYAHPQALWLITPIMLYWFCRVWLLAARGQLHEDPVVFALTDLHSYFAGLLVLGLIIAASMQ